LFKDTLVSWENKKEKGNCALVTAPHSSQQFKCMNLVPIKRKTRGVAGRFDQAVYGRRLCSSILQARRFR
jgi:hypothetical protein